MRTPSLLRWIIFCQIKLLAMAPRKLSTSRGISWEDFFS
uniref:Uncharacterized protein n=1 Tax=Rhizophora mucronata TaxID=61149 RepID=A0A2P2QZ23_RHIMU